MYKKISLLIICNLYILYYNISHMAECTCKPDRLGHIDCPTHDPKDNIQKDIKVIETKDKKTLKENSLK